MTLASKCAASMQAADNDVLIDRYDPTGRIGTDVHRAIAMALIGEDYPPFAEDPEQCELLVERAVDWFRSNYDEGLAIETEAALEGLYRQLSPLSISTIIDVLMEKDPREAVVVDWKTTYVDNDHEPQAITQAWCVFQNGPFERVRSRFVFLRNNYEEEKVYTREWVDAWMQEFVHNMVSHPDIYNVGPHCGRCKRYASCPAISADNRATADALLQEPGSYLNREVAANMLAHVDLLEDRISAFRQFVRESVIRDGDLMLPGDRMLHAFDQTRRIIQVMPAWPLLEKTFTEGELGLLLKVPKGKLEELVGERAPRGGKGTAKKAFLQALTDLGAIVEEKYVTVKETSSKEIEHE